MDSTNRTAVVLKSVRMPLIETCRHIKGSLVTLAELPKCLERDRVEGELLYMANCIRECCRAFNNARSRMATLEKVSGTQHPFFYQGELRCPGRLPTSKCDCGLRPGNVAEADAKDRDSDGDDEKREGEPADRGE